jgi:hypothetical protein
MELCRLLGLKLSAEHFMAMISLQNISCQEAPASHVPVKAFLVSMPINVRDRSPRAPPFQEDVMDGAMWNMNAMPELKNLL